MSHYVIDSTGPSPGPASTLAVLADAFGGRFVPPARRVIAGADSRCPGEGLAILGAYVAIADQRVRQAVLDALLTIADADREG